MSTMRKGIFKLGWALSLGILLLPGSGFAARSAAGAAVATKATQAAPIVPPAAAAVPVQTTAGNMNAQDLSKAISLRKAGRAAMLKEMTKQAERDWVNPETMQEVIVAPATKVNRFTQSEAHLSLSFVRNLISKNYKVEPYLDIISEALVNEAKYKNSHYAFYNTTSNMWRLAQDLDTRLFARFNPTGENKGFKFLRFNDEFINSTAQSFLVNELKQKGLVDDNTSTAAILLSVNLSLFGNVGFPGECSWQYFVKPPEHRKPYRDTYEKMMVKYGLTDKYIDELMKLADIYDTEEDTILQVFIPRDKVDEIGYLAWVKGIPFHGETIDLIKKLAGSKAFTRVKPTMEKLTANFARQKESNPLYKSMMEGIVAGDFSLSSFLKVYCNKPWDLKEINDVTARLLFTPDVLGNPQSGVIINRLSTVSHAKLKEYNDQLNAIIEKMVSEKEAREDMQAKTVK